MNQPAYLWKNNRGIYFFRARIPKQFLLYFNGTEIKKSLKTDSLRLAIKLARVYRVKLDEEMSKLEKGTYGAYQATLEGKIRGYSLPNGQEKAITGKIERNLAAEDEDTSPHKEYLLRQLCAEVERIEKQARDSQLHQVQLSVIAAPYPTLQPALPVESFPSLSEVTIEYLNEGETLDRWKERSKEQVKATLALFEAIVGGDIQFKKIDKATARDFKQKYIKLPANMNKKAAYRDKSIQEMLAMEIPEQDRAAQNTINNNLTRISTLFKWAVDQGYIEKNPIDGLAIGKKKRASEERQAFDQSDLVKLFESKEYRKGFKHPYQYWLPIISLYSGMRLEEICRLQVNNFKMFEGISCIEISEDGEWRGKTSAALREIPIHPKLEELV